MTDTIGITFDILEGKSVTNYCRTLIDKGFEPNTRLEVRRDFLKPSPDLVVHSIGEGAKLNLVENNTEGPKFGKYTPYPTRLKVDSRGAVTIAGALK